MYYRITNLGNKAELAATAIMFVGISYYYLSRQKQRDNKTGDKLALDSAVTSPNETTIELNKRLSNFETAAQLTVAFTTMSQNVTSLDLSWNNIYKIGTGLTTSFASIPPNVNCLSLYGNHLHYLPGNELATIFAAIPANVTSLNLGANLFGNKRNGSELAIALAGIPASVTVLDLSDNLLDSFGSELDQVLAAIPSSITTLKLHKNDLNKLSLDMMKQLKDKLPHLRTIYLSHSDMVKMSTEQCHALKDAFPNLENVILLDKEDKQLGGTDLRAQANFARAFAFKTQVPSLLNQCAFFVSKNKINITNGKIPNELVELVGRF